MVDLEAHCHPTTTILDGWSELGSPLLLSLVSFSCSSSATVSASCGGALGGLVSVWVSVTLSGASATGQGLWLLREASGFAFKVC